MRRSVNGDIRRISCMDEDEMYTYAKEIRAPFHLVKETAELGRLPVVNFAAGGVATPGRRSLNDAARRRWRLRRQRHLQERGAGEARQRDRQGGDALQRRADSR